MPRRARTIVVPHAELVGRTVTLRVARLAAAGAFLGVDPVDGSPGSNVEAPSDGTILLPQREVPEGASVGTTLTVFVTLDSEDRPLATTRAPALQLGEVAFLRVTAVTRVGVFVDWGLPKELLVPFREQTRDVRVGERHPIALFVDKTGRLAGTMRVSEFLRTRPAVRVGEWIAGEAWRSDPAVGLFVIAERRFVGLVPKSEPHGLARGGAAMFRVTRVRPDGKFELSLRAEAHTEIADDAAHVLAILRASRGPRVGDHSPPEEIRTRFGLSKKAFKRAVGRLLKEGSIVIAPDGAVSLAAPPSGEKTRRPRAPRIAAERTRDLA